MCRLQQITNKLKIKHFRLYSVIHRTLHINIALDKMGFQITFFLFLHENICYGYSLEAPWRGTSNEYPQHMFLWRNKKNISTFWLKKKAAYQELCINKSTK